MKTILIVTDAWSPQVNGVVRTLQAIIPRIEARGYKVVVVEPRQYATFAVPFYKEIRLAFFPYRGIKKVIEDIHPDAIHIATEGPLGWTARRVCIKKKIHFSTWYHSHFQLYIDIRLHGLFWPVFAYIRHFHKKAARIFVSTDALKEGLEKAGFENLTVIPLGVDTELFKRNPSPALPALPKPVFVYFSRLASEKSPEEFLKLDLPGTKLVIGDGPLRKKLENTYQDSMFVGYKKGQELVDWLSLADVFVFPSRTETFGLVALEAMACGLPVAAHDVMGPKDLVTEGEDGYLSEDLREAALKCLDLSRDDCRAKALEYSWDHSAEAFIRNLFPTK